MAKDPKPIATVVVGFAGGFQGHTMLVIREEPPIFINAIPAVVAEVLINT